MKYCIEAHVACGEAPVLGFSLGLARGPEPYKLSRRNKDNGFMVTGVNFADGSSVALEHRAVTGTRAEARIRLDAMDPTPKFLHSLWSSGNGSMTTRRIGGAVLVKLRLKTAGYSGHEAVLESVKLYQRAVRSWVPYGKLPPRPFYALTQLSWHGELPRAARKMFTGAVWSSCGGLFRGTEIFHDKADGDWENQYTCHPASEGRLLWLDDLICFVDDVDKNLYGWATKEK